MKLGKYHVAVPSKAPRFLSITETLNGFIISSGYNAVLDRGNGTSNHWIAANTQDLADLIKELMKEEKQCPAAK